MFGEYQSTMILCEGSNEGGPLQKKKKNFEMHTQQINMDLQECIVIKDI